MKKLLYVLLVVMLVFPLLAYAEELGIEEVFLDRPVKFNLDLEIESMAKNLTIEKETNYTGDTYSNNSVSKIEGRSINQITAVKIGFSPYGGILPKYPLSFYIKLGEIQNTVEYFDESYRGQKIDPGFYSALGFTLIMYEEDKVNGLKLSLDAQLSKAEFKDGTISTKSYSYSSESRNTTTTLNEIKQDERKATLVIEKSSFLGGVRWSEYNSDYTTKSCHSYYYSYADFRETTEEETIYRAKGKENFGYFIGIRCPLTEKFVVNTLISGGDETGIKVIGSLDF